MEEVLTESPSSSMGSSLRQLMPTVQEGRWLYVLISTSGMLRSYAICYAHMLYIYISYERNIPEVEIKPICRRQPLKSTTTSLLDCRH